MTPVQVQNRSFLLLVPAVLLVSVGLVGPSQAQPRPLEAQKRAAEEAWKVALAAAQEAQELAHPALAATHQAVAAMQAAGAMAQQAGAATQMAQALGQQSALAGQKAAAARKNVDDLRAKRKPIKEAEKVAVAAGQEAQVVAQHHQVATKQAAAARQTAGAAAKQAEAMKQTAHAATLKHHEAAKKAQVAADHAAVEARKVVTATLMGKEAAVLSAAYVLLAAANSDYEGHKGRAMHSVESVIRVLDASILTNGKLKQRTAALKQVFNLDAIKSVAINMGVGNKTDVLSDTYLLQARGVLTLVGLDYFVKAKQLGGLGHIETAIREIDLALVAAARHALTGKEADVLTLAYIYLAAANHDYDGHRAQAMNRVESAVRILNANLLERGSLEQKIRAMRDEIARGVTKARAQQQYTVHEDQHISDAQLMIAGALVQRVAIVMAQRNQALTLMYLTDGLTEISIALTIR
jgi:hypothetical protein